MNCKKISIIVLTWNGFDYTVECVKSLRKIHYGNYEIIVVDNGSTDYSSERIKMLFPEVISIRNKENLGFAEGNNVGIRYALEHDADYILLLNNDTVVDPQILENFVKAADLYPEAGIFGAKIYYYNEPDKIIFAGGKWDSKNKGFTHIGIDKTDNDEFSRIREIDYACGCALFFKRKVAEIIGLLDPSFFVIFEETDWCYRARKEGIKSIFVPNAKVWHRVSSSFGGQKSPLFIYFFTRNRLLWAKKNLPPAQKWGVYASILKEFFPSSFNLQGFSFIKKFYWDILKIRQNYKTPQFKARISGVTDFIFNRLNLNDSLLRANQFK